MARSKADKLASSLSTPTPREPPIPPESFLSTGCTLLNCAFTGHPTRGVPKGTFWYVVGDSGSLKTWLTFSLFAEAARNDHFDDYQFIYDGPENGALMDVPKFFGAATAGRITPPRGSPDEPQPSETVQQFYFNLDLAVKNGPCIYVCDSMDGLNDDADEERFDAEVKRFDTGKGEVPGSMGMAKAKTNSRNINRAVQSLRKSGSILVVISQTRDKVGGHIPGLKTRGGGRALRFYGHCETWTSVRAPLTRRYHGKDREYGSTIRFDVQKNRINGWEGKFDVDFLKGVGIDDIGTNCNYLLEEKHWKKGKKTSRKSEDETDSEGSEFTAPEFDFTGNKEQLVKLIQDNNDEQELAILVGKVWRDIVAGALPPRKARYT